MPRRYNNNRVLVFSDPHFPYAVKGWHKFLKEIRDDIHPDRVICNGDLLDCYGVSSYPKDLSHPDSWSTEIKHGREEIKRLAELFPKLEIADSNHDSRLYKKSMLAGIPREALLPYRDMIGAPEGWKFFNRLRIRSEKHKKCWLFAHTIDGGAANAAKHLGCSVAIGHHHPRFSISAFNNGDSVLYGVDTGCLISDQGSPFSYNKTQVGRPIRGCAIIIDGVPQLIPYDI